MKTFIQSQYNYCSLTCMFHNRTLNNKINKLHEKALRLVYENDDLTFQELLDKDNSVTLHDRNLQRLAVEMLTPSPMQTLFSEQSYRHDLRYKKHWAATSVRTVMYSTETIRYRGPNTWELLPIELKGDKSLTEFKSKIKYWNPQRCACRLCGTYIFNIGFIS